MDLGNLGAVASGGVLGLLGPIIKQGFSYFERRQSMAHEIAMLPHKERADIRLMEREQAAYAHEKDLQRIAADAAQDETERELLLGAQGISREGLSASIGHDVALQSVTPWVNDARAMVRPVITLALWLITAAFFFWGEGSPHQSEIVKATLFAATTATVWWFGDRPATLINQFSKRKKRA